MLAYILISCFIIFICIRFLQWILGESGQKESFSYNTPPSTPASSTPPSSTLTGYFYQEEIGIKIAMSLAMADGKLHKSEATVINRYMKSVINSQRNYDRENLKDHLNASLLSAKKLSDNNQLKTGRLCHVAANNFEEQYQFETIQLCLDVMAADGKADREELIQIDKIADKIGINSGSENMDYISLRDKALISLKPNNVTKGDTIDEKLGIKKSWSKKKKLDFIVNSFKKWNARMGIVKTSRERKNIQNILNLLSDAHEKYK